MEVIEMIPNPAVIAHKKSFEELYERAFPSVARFVSKMNGSLEDAKDIFHEALVVFCEKNQNEKSGIFSEEAYIKGIAKHLWIKKFKHDRNKVSFDANEGVIEPPDKPDPQLNNLKLLQMLVQTGEKCMDLLRSFYFEKLPMKAIAIHFGYRNERTATVQKFKCIEKIREAIKENSISYEDFFE